MYGKGTVRYSNSTEYKYTSTGTYGTRTSTRRYGIAIIPVKVVTRYRVATEFGTCTGTGSLVYSTPYEYRYRYL